MSPKKILFLLFCFLPLLSFARIRPVTVLEPSHWKLMDLNSWAGRPRNSVQLTLPPHTVGLVYIISSVTDKELEFYSNNARFNFLRLKYFKNHKYLADYLADFYSGNPEDSIKSLPFLRPIDTVCTFGAFLFSDSLACLAFDKGKPAECINPYSFPKFKGGMVSLDIIDDPEPNNLWLGFANSSTGHPVYVTVEAVALVNVPADTVKPVVLTKEALLKRKAGFKEAVFPGPTNVGSYIYDNMNDIISSVNHHIKGSTSVELQISETGQVHDVRVVRGHDYEMDAEVMSVLKAMPLWKPATQNGKPVNSYMHYELYY